MSLNDIRTRLDELEEGFPIPHIPRRALESAYRAGAEINVIYGYEDGQMHYADLDRRPDAAFPPQRERVAAIGICALQGGIAEGDVQVCWLSKVGHRELPRENPEGAARSLPTVLKSCVNQVLTNEGFSAQYRPPREEVSRAIAICTSALQRSGKLVEGTRRLTPAGHAYEEMRYPTDAVRQGIERTFDAMIPPRRAQPTAAAGDRRKSYVSR